MKILLDTCVWGGVVQELRAAGHDVVWAGDWQEDPGDDEILEWAHQKKTKKSVLCPQISDLDFRFSCHVCQNLSSLKASSSTRQETRNPPFTRANSKA